MHKLFTSLGVALLLATLSACGTVDENAPINRPDNQVGPYGTIGSGSGVPPGQ